MDNIKISKFKLRLIFLIFPFLEPQSFSILSGIDNIFLIWKLFVFAYILFIYLATTGISKYFLAIFIWRIYVQLDSVILLKYVDTATTARTITILGITMILEYGGKKHFQDTIEAIFNVLFLFSFANLITCFTNGLFTYNGMQYFVLGIRTRFTDSAVPLVTLSFLLSYLKKNRLFSSISILTLLVVSLQLLMQWVATGIFVILLLVLVCILFEHRPSRFKGFYCFLAGIFLNISIVFLRIQSYFEFIIVDMLHKSMSLNGRTTIWDTALAIINGNKIFGLGEAKSGGFVPVSWADTLAPAHNMILQIIHDGGIISAILLFICFCLAFFELRKCNDKKVILYISAGLVVSTVAFLTEISCYYVHFYILPVLATQMFRTNQFNKDSYRANLKGSKNMWLK